MADSLALTLAKRKVVQAPCGNYSGAHICKYPGGHCGTCVCAYCGKRGRGKDRADHPSVADALTQTEEPNDG